MDSGEQPADALGRQLARLLAGEAGLPAPMLAEDLAYELAIAPLEPGIPTRPVPTAERPPQPALGM